MREQQQKSVLIRTFRFRLYPNKNQEQILEGQLGLCCEVYNELISARFESFLLQRELQNETLRDLKICNPKLKKVYSQVLQQLTQRVDLVFTKYFSNIKQRIRPAGKPRF